MPDGPPIVTTSPRAAAKAGPGELAGAAAPTPSSNDPGDDGSAPLLDLGDLDLEELAGLPLSALRTSLSRILDLDGRDAYVAFNSSI